MISRSLYLLLLCLPLPVLAQTTSVDPSGVYRVHGAQSSPWVTFSAEVTIREDGGDLVVHRTATYTSSHQKEQQFELTSSSARQIFPLVVEAEFRAAVQATTGAAPTVSGAGGAAPPAAENVFRAWYVFRNGNTVVEEFLSNRTQLGSHSDWRRSKAVGPRTGNAFAASSAASARLQSLANELRATGFGDWTADDELLLGLNEERVDAARLEPNPGQSWEDAIVDSFAKLYIDNIGPHRVGKSQPDVRAAVENLNYRNSSTPEAKALLDEIEQITNRWIHHSELLLIQIDSQGYGSFGDMNGFAVVNVKTGEAVFVYAGYAE